MSSFLFFILLDFFVGKAMTLNKRFLCDAPYLSHGSFQ